MSFDPGLAIEVEGIFEKVKDHGLPFELSLTPSSWFDLHPQIGEMSEAKIQLRQNGDTVLELVEAEISGPRALKHVLDPKDLEQLQVRGAVEPLSVIGLPMIRKERRAWKVQPARSPSLIACSNEAFRCRFLVFGKGELTRNYADLSMSVGNLTINLEGVAGNLPEPTTLVPSISYIGNISSPDGSPVQVSDLSECIHGLWQLFSVVLGFRLGIGCVQMLDAAGQIMAFELGMRKPDSFNAHYNWYHEDLSSALPTLFCKLVELSRKPAEFENFTLANQLVRTAGASQELSVEVALVTSVIGLELLVNDALVQSFGWSNSQVKKNGNTLAIKLRAAFKAANLDVDPVEHFRELKSRLQSEKWVDGFEAVVKYRNHLVHSKKVFSPSGWELFEAYRLSQWLCQLLLLRRLDYSGSYRDTRLIQGWRDTLAKWPLS